MGFLEISVEMLQYSGGCDYSGPSLGAWLLYLIAVLILVSQLRPPGKDEQLF